MRQAARSASVIDLSGPGRLEIVIASGVTTTVMGSAI